MARGLGLWGSLRVGAATVGAWLVAPWHAVVLWRVAAPWHTVAPWQVGAPWHLVALWHVWPHGVLQPHNML